MKYSYPQWDSNPVSAAKEVTALNIALRGLIFIEFVKRLMVFTCVTFKNVPVARCIYSKDEDTGFESHYEQKFFILLFSLDSLSSHLL